MSHLFSPHLDFLEHTLKQEGVFEAREQTLPNTQIIFHDLGILELAPIEPKQDGVILSAGIHGNETAPIELLNNLVMALLDRDCMNLARPVLVILGHPLAMREGKRFIEFNMNRLFLGQHTKTEYRSSYDAKRAASIERLVGDFCTRHKVIEHYDLHTAIRASEIERFALAPLVSTPVSKSARICSERFLAQAGTQALVQQNTYANTFSSHTGNQLALVSYTLELGKVHAFGQNDLARYQNTAHALEQLICPNEQLTHTHDNDIDRFEVCHEIIVPDETFTLHIGPEQANFGAFKKGELIWESLDQRYLVQHEKEYIIFPNPDVPVGQRAGLLLIKTD